MLQQNANIAPETVVAVALSGGLDSLMAAWKLARSGHRVIGLHGRFLGGQDFEPRLEALHRACEFIGIPLEVADLRLEFRARVVEPFIAAYAAGLTPNPCALCNPNLKFGLLLERALSLGAEVIATGHYARKGIWQSSLAATDGRREFTTIYPATDQSKDQSYFLALVPGESLNRVIFPLHSQSKQELRNLAAEMGLPVPESRESQEICFVPNDDYRAFLQSSGVKLPGGGPVRLSDGREISRHQGLWQYTEGQRRGLGIAWAEPLYVLAKDVPENALVVGPGSELRATGCNAGNLNLLVPFELWPARVLARVRYRQKAVPARVEVDAEVMRIAFESPQDPPARGQLAVIYHPEGFILGGGIIC